MLDSDERFGDHGSASVGSGDPRADDRYRVGAKRFMRRSRSFDITTTAPNAWRCRPLHAALGGVTQRRSLHQLM
jgi:hypothetical protein